MTVIVPRPSEVEPYDDSWFTWSQQGRILARYREATLQQRLRGDYYRQQEQEQHEHATLVAEDLTDLDDHIQSKLNASKSPRREAALERVYEVATDMSLRNLKRAYGDGR
jgi:hypothetical protein